MQLSRLFLGLFNLLHGPHFFVLEHAYTISQQFNVSLELKTDRAGLIVCQVFTLDVNDDVRADLTIVYVLALGSLIHESALAAL